MHLLDWLILIAPLLAVVMIGVATQRHMKSVAHFISGGRVGGRYLLAVAKGEMQAGAVVFVAQWELFGRAGFVPTWWIWLSLPVGLLLAISGFVIYRFRETKAMTLAQFFEIRYSRNFRLFTGVIGFLAGAINFGIIPAVGARFMVYFLQLPPEIIIGAWSFPTYVLLMGIFLSITLVLTISGGLITLMVTDCIEGIFSQLIYLLLIVGVFCVVKWSEIGAVLGNQPAGYSLVNPFDAWKVQDFNLWYVLMGVFLTTYGTMAFQNSGSYNSAGATPHETRMASVLSKWREMGKQAVVTLLGAAALTYLAHPDFADSSKAARDALASISQPQIQTQMTIPVALSYLLPIGMKGALCVVLLLGIFGGDSTHLHSWGSILAQDVILPRLKKAPTPAGHIRLLRACIAGVALFAFVFGALFQQTEYILMWWNVTTAVYVGGAGAAIIGGLYWKKGTSAGAWTAMITGVVLSGGGILAYKLWGDRFLSEWLQAGLGLFGVNDAVPSFDINGIQISFFATLISILLYVAVSLATCRQDYPLQKMLHREGLPATENGNPVVAIKNWTFSRLIGVDEHFTRSDKLISFGAVLWTVSWLLVMLVGSAWNLIGQSGWVSWIKPWSNEAWLGFWQVAAIGLPIFITVVTGIWFTWGGVRDLRALFRSLKSSPIDASDNGTVQKHKPY